MKTKTIKVCDAVKIVVDCVDNDPVDIRCGGDAVLGFDFFVSPDVKIDEWEGKIKEMLKKHKQPLMGIRHYPAKDFPVNKLWTLEKIEACIKQNPM